MDRYRLELLQSMPIFGGLKESTLQFLADRSHNVHHEPGEYYFREGDSALSMFVLEKGAVAVTITHDGEEHHLKTLSQGDCFGEMAMIDLYPRSASVKAVEPTDAMELPNTLFLELYKSDLEQFTLIQMNISREISRRLRDSNSGQ